MEYYSANKKNAFESVLMRWMKLEPIIQRSKSERKTPIRYINLYAEYIMRNAGLEEAQAAIKIAWRECSSQHCLQ